MYAHPGGAGKKSSLLNLASWEVNLAMGIRLAEKQSSHDPLGVYICPIKTNGKHLRYDLGHILKPKLYT